MPEKEQNTAENKYFHEEAGKGPVEVSSKVDFPELDHVVQKLWDEKDVFQRTIKEREGCKDYIAYDGPPGTNGVPHVGHLMQSALKDLWPRYFTMKGFRCLRKAGWDTHGLPVELTAEKELGLKSKKDIIEFGVEKYIEYCRKTVFRYKDAWTKAIKRCGRFLDVENYYATLTRDYIQTDWWVLKQAWNKGLLYEGRRVMPHCTRCGTSLSSHETAQGYEDITDISLYVKFRLAEEKNTYFIAWTTTAWTLLSNVALAVNPDLTYVTVQKGDEKYIFAEARLEALKENLGDYKILEKRKGRDIEGFKYQPLWEFLNEAGEQAHRVIADDYVTAEDGSGIVHLALYGEDDFRLIQSNDIPLIQNVSIDGIVKENVKPFAGRWFRDQGLDVDILKDLAAHGLLFGKEKIIHSYPHCYRCDTPLMYFAKSGWFLKTSAIKEQMMRANEDINWYPEHIKRGRFGNWLENNVDWSISRERYWGSPIPIWTCDQCDHRVCVESLAELSEVRGEPLPDDFDPHKPEIDRVEWQCEKCEGTMKHETAVLDPWFNAGIMPWGQWGYPAKPGSKELLENQYPGDFICEAIDQTRGWFYTLLATATILTDRSSFKHVICTEHILDDNGYKMSKSRGNIVDPVEQCEKFGADAVRWNFFNVHPWTVRRWKDEDVDEILKKLLIPYWNAYSFFVTYARVDNWSPEDKRAKSPRLLDKWITSRLERLREEVEMHLQAYSVAKASNALEAYIDDLTNWYIRRSRRRFWKSEDDSDKKDAYKTLYFVLTNLNRILAPFIPFVTEVIYQNLERGYNKSASDSVHLCYYPAPDPDIRELTIEDNMEAIRKVVTLGRSLRNEGKVRVRQPLAEVAVSGLPESFDAQYIDLICDELNVKEFRAVSNPRDLYGLKAKPDFKKLGPRFGKKMKQAAAEISSLSPENVQKLSDSGKIDVLGETIAKDDVELIAEPVEGYWVRGESGVAVGLKYEIDEQLYHEWLAREVVHHIQNLRKKADLDVTERITVEYGADSKLSTAIQKHKEYISNEVLALNIVRMKDIETDSYSNIGDCMGVINILV